MKKNFNNSVSEDMLIEKIGKDSIKKTVAVSGVVDRVIQTGGPTIFGLRDGTGSLAMKGFIAPGERAHPEIDEGDFIDATVRVDEFNGELEGNIVKIYKREGEAGENISKTISRREKDKARVEPKEFLVKHPTLEKLKDSFIEAATEIRLAVFQNRPIIVRHHNDTDGYCSGFALERAIIPLIQKQHSSEKAAWEFFQRAPCQAPYYEIDDSIRDTANSLRNVAKFSNKMPLIVIADNGSTQEDLMAIKQGKIHGADFIVVDHHGFDKDVISDEVKVHINPFLVGESGSSFSAGMLCAELGRIINPDVTDSEQIPALAGLADRIDLENPKTVNEYVALAEAKGYSRELLGNISLVIEYVSAKVRFMEAREYIEVLFGEPRERQGKLIELMAPYIRDLDAKGLAIGKSNRNIEKVGKIDLQTVHIENTFPGFGFFPKPGRSISLLHDHVQKEEGLTSVVSIGLMNTAMTFRATDGANFSMHEMIGILKEKCPNAFVEGGGHKNAGAITFLPNKKEEIFSLVKDFISKR